MIAEEIRQSVGKKNRSGDWYVSQLEGALSSVQEDNVSLNDTQGFEMYGMYFFSYGVKWPEKYEFWDVQPLAVVLRIDHDGWLGCNLHYINPDYRDSVANGLLNKGTTVPKNSLHKYLYSGIGNLHRVPETEDWGAISLLPTEKFMHNSGRKYPKHRAFNWRT
tara:strand:- start:3013 stop:3501 length:489 start_codon:yes stop_codon:yes gene_type:complete